MLTYMVSDKLCSSEKPNKEMFLEHYPEFKELSHCIDQYLNECIKVYLRHLNLDFDINNKKYHHPFAEILTSNVKKLKKAVHQIKRGKKYEWHVDSYPGNRAGDVPFLQFILYLNTLEPGQGGKTKFINGRKVRPEVGKIVIFPRSWTFPHCGKKVKADYKYIIAGGVEIS